MNHSIFCDDNERRQRILAHPTLNGIDFIEVSAFPLDAQRFIRVTFLKTDHINDLVGRPDLFRLEGGVRITDIRILDVVRVDDHLEVEVAEPGDFSLYTLIIQAAWLDPVYARKTFSFKAGCPTDFDCRPDEDCPDEPLPPPLIDYMAKDYASFRQALLDLIPLRNPNWLERNPADMGIALLETLAYAADQLSYYQDAIANEAYLETARQRISVRRHARLIDYQMHDGASARAFVHVGCDDAGSLPQGTAVLTKITRRIGAGVPGSVIAAADNSAAQSAATAVFETMQPAYVHPDLNQISLYPWSNRQCCLPRGSTAVDLAGNLSAWFSPAHLIDAGSLAGKWRDAASLVSQYIHDRLPPAMQALLAAYSDGDPVSADLQNGLLAGLNDILTDAAFYTPARFSAVSLTQYEQALAGAGGKGTALIRLNRFLLEAAYVTELATSAKLLPGDYLLFEEVLGVATGIAADADREHRQVVRLTDVSPAVDPLEEVELTAVAWDAADALTFPLCISALTSLPIADGGPYVEDITIARGNLVLADHGRTIAGESHAGPTPPPDEKLRRAHRFLLQEGPLSWRISMPTDNGSLAPAAALFTTDPHQVQPQVTRLQVAGTLPPDDWQPVPHLLDSDEFAHHFAVETDNDGRSLLRFGDNEYGLAPPDGAAIDVTYRIGVGRSGNVGADALVHLVQPAVWDDWPTITAVRNPLASWGGIDPQTLDEVKQLAPAAFHAEQKRAVTESDYARAAALHPEVAKAVATFRWTGSWHTVFITIDPVGRTDVDAPLQQRVRRWVQRFTQAGYDLEIDPPTFVPLEIEIEICVSPAHFRAHVQENVLLALSNRVLRNGRPGFFHPDNFSFGQPLYLSRLYAAVENVSGVDSATVRLFKRYTDLPNQELEQGFIPMGRLEVVRLDNDPNFPENGVLRLQMLGGK